MSQSAATVPAAAAPRVLADQGSRVTRRARRRALRPFLMVGGVIAVIVASAGYWLHSGRIVSIDDAYVRAAKLAVSTDVSGIVSEVSVKEGQRVKQGEVLFRLDQRPFLIALAGAKANLVQVALSMDAMKRDYQRMLKDIDTRQAQVDSDQASFARFAS